ncbi:MAG: T9SS type A sorting domain-containing protein [Aquaticitalea sp.]
MNSKFLKIIAFCFIASCNNEPTKAQAPFGSPGEHTPVALGSSESSFGYYEYLPLDFDASADNTYPLLLCYHGYDQRGNGTSNLSAVLGFGPPNQVEQGMDFEAIIISPQTSSGTFSTADFLGLYNYLVANYPIDINRVYITGLSAGGGGVWNALRGHSDKIAAAVPICGTTLLDNPSEFLQQTPIWAFHNFNDGVVSRENTISNVSRIANVGESVLSVYPSSSEDSPADDDYSMEFDTSTQTWYAVLGVNNPEDKLSFTMYSDGEHDAWSRTYTNESLWEWMFAQSLNTLDVDEKTLDFSLYPNPCSGKFTISSKNENEKQLEVFDFFGKKIYSNSFSNELIVNMSTYASGVYLVKVIGDNDAQKVIKVFVN